MTTLDDTTAVGLRRRLQGSVLEPGDGEFAEATFLWNAMIERTQRSLYSACRASQSGSSSHWRNSPSINARTTIAASATDVCEPSSVLPITAAY